VTIVIDLGSTRIHCRQIQKLAQAINALNENNFGNVDTYTNVAGLIPSTFVSVYSSSASSWILDTSGIDHIVSHMSLLTRPKSSNITKFQFTEWCYNTSHTQLHHYF